LNINKTRSGLAILTISCLFFLSCEHLQITPKNFRGGNCDPDTVYFANDIAPLLISKCATPGCHDSKSAKHGVITDSYNNIIKTAGIMVGNGLKSEVIKTLRKTGSETMPPDGKLPDSDIAMIRKWIDQGAQNNRCISGCDSTSFTYSKDISSIINKNCIGCHGSGSTIPLNSHFDVKRKVDDGRLWGSVNHLSGYKFMPSDNTTISVCDMDKLRNWIAIGAPDN
jgi:hypothetical protein